MSDRLPTSFNEPLSVVDPEIAAVLEQELGRQRDTLEMIASENFVSRAKKIGAVSKGAKPDHVRLAPLPRNFKGVVKVPDLKEEWQKLLGAKK